MLGRAQCSNHPFAFAMVHTIVRSPLLAASAAEFGNAKNDLASSASWFSCAQHCTAGDARICAIARRNYWYFRERVDSP